MSRLVVAPAQGWESAGSGRFFENKWGWLPFASTSAPIRATRPVFDRIAGTNGKEASGERPHGPSRRSLSHLTSGQRMSSLGPPGRASHGPFVPDAVRMFASKVEPFRAKASRSCAPFGRARES